MLNFYEGDDCNFEDPGDPDAEGSEALDEIPLPVTPDKGTIACFRYQYKLLLSLIL